jgi:sugar phosphate isomerase/epimerase
MGNINLQLYSFMDGAPYDTKNNLQLTSKMGYDGVELFGPNLEIPAPEMKKLLQELGLQPISLHTSTDQILDLLPYAKCLEMQFIGIGMATLINDEAVYTFSEQLNSLGEICHKEGIMITYHNHTQEFAKCQDQTMLEVLIERTNPQYVGFELDAGWCAAAGVDPIAFVKKHSGRIKLIHIKESSEVIGVQPTIDLKQMPLDKNGAPIFSPEVKAMFEHAQKINCAAGKGIVDWAALKKAADQHGCAAYIVEREYTYDGNRQACLQADLNYYRTII